MAWEIAHAQSRGGRATQEDAYGIFGQSAGGPCLIVVADGAGGHAEGEKASQAALARFGKAVANMPATAVEAVSWLTQTVGEADRDVASLGAGAAAPRTTVAAAWLDTVEAALIHVGDSRLYHCRKGQVLFRTADHSVVQLLLDMGRLTEAEARRHPDRSRLLKALGTGEGPADDPVRRALQHGDGIAICSDGVWEQIDAPDIATALLAPSLDLAAAALVERAVDRGGPDSDNATLILARLR